MKQTLAVVLTAALVSAAIALSGPRRADQGILLERGPRLPATTLQLPLGADDFQFAVVSDRTGGHRAHIFERAVDKLNLLQPAFVVSAGDLIEGGKKDDVLAGQWKEFDGLLQKLTVPFFYVSGNHDVGTVESRKFWQDKLGRRHYAFVYRGVLFLMLDSDDPPAAGGAMSKGQLDDVRKILAAHADARWTMVFVHRPLWNMSTLKTNGWLELEAALANRPYTVICGHVHRYEKFVRQGRNYYQLATTGGGSKLRGVERGEFDHLVWVTMKKDGPILANLLVEAIHDEDLVPTPTQETGVVYQKKPTQPVQGRLYMEGVPVADALVVFALPVGGATRGNRADGWTRADGSFTLSTYAANDGIPAGEYQVSVIKRQPCKDAQNKAGPSVLPARYAQGATSGLKVTIAEGVNEVKLEMKK